MINDSGIFGPLNYNISGKDDDYGCFVSATRRSDGIEVSGSRVTIGIAKAEGWYSKAGSKWKSMPEQMLRYRAAMFFARTECPQVLLGMQSRDEIIDSNPEYVSALPPAKVQEIQAIPIDEKPEPNSEKPKTFPPLRICCNTKCPAYAPDETSGCSDTDPMRKDPDNPDNPYLYHCDRFVQIGPHAILKPLQESVSDAKEALGWTHQVNDKAEKWQLVYKILGIEGV
jgi:hypothetical protein